MQLEQKPNDGLENLSDQELLELEALYGAICQENRLCGAAKEAFDSNAEEVLVEGPAGTGKSLGSLAKLHYCCEKYPSIRALMLRKTRASLTDAALVTFETKVVPEGHPILQSGGQRHMRQHYVYPNGSEIVIRGLDKPEKVMSTDFDLAYIQEACECEEDDIEKVTTRLRHGKLPFQQLLMDCNPDTPTHWLNQRCISGITSRLLSRHEDNPVFYDHEKGEWTAAGLAYLGKLDRLTGARKARLRYGLWAGAEGTVYEEEWDAKVHIIDRKPIPDDWDRYWVFDFGFNNPFVWHDWATNPDGDLILVQEIYRTGRIVEDHCIDILAATQEWRVRGKRPKALICDHDAEDRATLERHLKMQTVSARKFVTPGIEATKARMKIGKNGKPRIYFMRDARIHPADQQLKDDHKPTCTVEEFDGYVWDLTGGQKKGDVPLKENDHGADGTRYMVAAIDLRRRTITPNII